MTKSEDKIQQEIVVFYRNNFSLKNSDPKGLIFSVPNDGKNLKEQLRKKATGLLAGVSDLILIHGGKVYFIEVKDEKGTQRPTQKEFEAEVKKQGFKYILVRSLEDFKKALKEWFIL